MSKRFYCPRNTEHLMRWEKTIGSVNFYHCPDCDDWYQNPMFDDVTLVPSESPEEVAKPRYVGFGEWAPATRDEMGDRLGFQVIGEATSFTVDLHAAPHVRVTIDGVEVPHTIGPDGTIIVDTPVIQHDAVIRIVPVTITGD